MTEDEAKRKRCPADVALNCIGSECMAWRSYSPTAGYCGLAGQERPIYMAADDGTIRPFIAAGQL